MAEECVFCKIARREIPAEILVESENFLSFPDANPKTEGHSLVIPKEHYENLLEIPDDLLGEYLNIIKKTADKLMKEKNTQGFNLVMNNGGVAGQVIKHAHLHILPRRKGDKPTFKTI